MTLDEIKNKLWDYYGLHGTEITRTVINSICEIPNHRKCYRMGLNLYELNKEFKIKYITEINITYCITCGNIIQTSGNKFCNTSCAATYNNKGKQHTKETRIKISNKLKYNIPSNKGNCSKIEKYCLTCGKGFKVYSNSKKVYCCRKCNPNLGGFREGTGKSKTGYYKGIYCGSTYELIWIIYRLDHGLEVKRFEGYIEENGKKYFPDFFVDGKIIEIKGWWGIDVDLKTRMAIDAGYEIEVKYKKDLQKEFEWVKQKYQYKDVFELYDNYKPIFEYICNNCGKLILTNRKRNTPTKFCNLYCVGKYRARIKKSLEWSSNLQ